MISSHFKVPFDVLVVWLLMLKWLVFSCVAVPGTLAVRLIPLFLPLRFYWFSLSRSL